MGGFSFIVPENWVIHRQIKDFNISLAYFKESGNAKYKMCQISINTVMPDHYLTLGEFLNRHISANIYLDTYEPTMVAGQPAFKGKDSFSLSGREGRLSIDRVFVKKEGIFVDMNLSYEEGKVDSQTVDLCKSDFDKLLQSSKLE